VPRRVNVPAADDLFRPTAVPSPEPEPGSPGTDDLRAVVELAPAKAKHARTAKDAAGAKPDTPAEAGPTPARTASGRVRHDEKMTVYVTADELLDIEHARLELRRSHGLGVDRGRIVRAAVAMALADLDDHGEDSALLRRLREG